MFFGSYFEFFSILIFILIFNVVKRLTTNESLLTLVLSAGNLVILSTFIDYYTLGVLSVLILIVFNTGRWIGDKARPERGRKSLLYLVLSLLVFLFCFRNYEWFQGFLTRYSFIDSLSGVSLVGRIGLSYILFRLLHFLVDAFRGKINEFDVFSFYNYVFFFATFLSGPIDRYNNYHFWQYRAFDRYSSILQIQGLGRIFIGAIKKLIIVPLIINYTTDVTLFAEISNDWFIQLAMSVLAYSFYIYFDFSGYSDIAIGTAYLIGIKTPENFNNPYFSGNISEFWKKWHISFSTILTEYIFKPFVIYLSSVFRWAPRLSISIIGYVYTFIICGLWHGSTLNFVYWGLWHGVGLAFYKGWEQLGWWKRLEGFRIYHAFRIFLTFIFVTIGWFFFMTDTTKVHAVLNERIVSISDDYATDQDRVGILNHYWEGYGWGIQLTYPSEEGNAIDVEYRPLGFHSWTSGIIQLSMKSGHFDVHGSTLHEKDPRNMESGWYEVRFRVNGGDWFGGLVVIPDYKRITK